jgi:GxxExxY protein
MQENEISGIIVDAAMKVHRTLGPGLFESVYHRVLAHELTSRGLQVASKRKIAIQYGELVIENAFETDLIVDEAVIVEVKAIESLGPVQRRQLHTYLKLSGLQLGLLINFHVDLLKDGIIRVVNGLPA